MHYKLLLLSCVIYLAHAAIIKVPSSSARKTGAQTPWDVVEAIYGTSGLLTFNGTWITGECASDLALSARQSPAV